MIRVHEHLRQHHRQHRAHGDADHLVTELQDAVGAQAPAGRAVLLHVAALAARDEQDGRAEQTDARVAQPQRSEDEDGQNEGAGEGVPVGDAQRDAVHQHEQEAKAHRDHEEEHRLVQHLAAKDHRGGAPEHDPQHQAQHVDTLPVFSRFGRLGALLSEPARGLDQDQRQVEDRRPEDGAERNDEADLAERVAFLQPADADEVGRLPDTDERDDQGGNRDACPDDHAGAERGGGDAQTFQRLDAGLREAQAPERRQVERE